MRVKYFADPDTALLEFSTNPPWKHGRSMRTSTLIYTIMDALLV